jgi:site-specific recombinase XerD
MTELLLAPDELHPDTSIASIADALGEEQVASLPAEQNDSIRAAKRAGLLFTLCVARGVRISE